MALKLFTKKAVLVLSVVNNNSVTKIHNITYTTYSYCLKVVTSSQQINQWASNDMVVQTLSYVVPASTTTANDVGITLCSQALSSAQSVPTFKIFNEAFKSR